ncbi:MAG: amidohydrolase family protein, partial [Candidatus Eremiobacteraeota bacterium]|nr:amidohydrolase family protein [Candidatus Eremiobacteraeota bacterium]
MVVADGRVASLRPEDAGAGVAEIDLGGRAVYPAFADCHVHLTDTGLFLGPHHLADVRDAAEYARRIAALPRGGFVLAANYDESAWSDGGVATAAPLDANFPDAIAMAVRVDGHSCVLNRKALAFVDLPPDTPGIERDADGAPTGRLLLDANWRAQAKVLSALPAAMKRAADVRATELALRNGALHLHVQLVGLGAREAYAHEIATLREAGAAKWHPKICERDPALAKELGLRYVGGDVFLDGSIGSGTAAVSEPYHDREGRGHLMHDDAEVEAYFAEAEQLGISAGVHAIGDRAIEQCLATWEKILGGKPSPRNRHFIEHFEIATPQQIARAAHLNVYLSMQPQFDELWGHPGGMYDTRLGAPRARTMNALASAKRAGATLVGGDDSPVCKLSPLDGLRAATAHHNPAESLTIEDALLMYTYDAARFGHTEATTGTLEPG